MSTIEEYQSQIDNAQSQIRGHETNIIQEEQKGTEKNNTIISSERAAINDLEVDVARLKGKIAELKGAAIEEKVQSDIPFSIPGVNLSELPFEVIGVLELIVKADRRLIYAEHAINLEQIEQERDDWKLLHGSVKADYGTLKQDYDNCAKELKDQTAETLQVIGERDDFKSKLANAATQIAEKDAEISRLKSEVEDYQQAKAFGERQAQKIIDVNTDEADNINKAIAKAKETWADKANRGLARWEFPTLPIPDLQEPPKSDEAEPSDNQLPNGDTEAASNIPDAPLSQFPGEETAESVDGESETVRTEAHADDQRVTRAEFEALKADVEALKRTNGLAA